MRKVVLDTNTLISALLWDGNEAEIIEKGEKKEIQLFISQEILEELRGVSDGLKCDTNYVYQKFLANELEWFNKNFIYKEACTIFGVKDSNNVAMESSKVWTFTTVAS